jgi:RNA polymerase sigma-70 factor (ECF subfamily)
MREIELQNKLVERCRKGDIKAQFALFKMHSKAMYNVAIRFFNNKMDAEDVVQESFIKAFQKIDEFNGYSSFGFWLKRIVINGCISEIRKRKITFEEINEELTGSLVEEKIDSFIEPDLVHNAIKALPEGARTIINLYALEGFKHDEISQMLGISSSTSKTQYMRAKKLLLEKLNK